MQIKKYKLTALE